jgi:integrase
VIPKLITSAEFKFLVDAVEGRDQLIIKLLAGTGMRISELINMKKSDLDFDNGLIRLQAHKKGSWLNMAEIELSALSKQCLDRRIGDINTLSKEIDAWQQERNDAEATVR